MADGDWSRVYVRCPRARVRLICFPHAGGAASAFRHWADPLAPDVEMVAVQYPGRQDRHTEPVPPDIGTLADDLASLVEPRLDLPAVLFGHSMGATVAFEVARRLRPRYPTPLRGLAVSARRAPSAPPPAARRLTDPQIRDYVRALGGSGARLLDDDELWSLALPTLRGDLRMVEDYRYVAGAPLTCPITAVVGSRDATVTSADAQLWADHTIAGFTSHVLPGGHFYLEDQAAPLLALLGDFLDAGADVPGGGREDS